MAYQALYRVWRSQRFDDVVGQTAITQTLKNAIIQDKISHAYMFTGPRGTGKTSAAKIFAKAINCPNSHDGEPCNECENCRAITNGQFDDVIEIDAASNNGVDEIRFLTDRANYSPTKGTYKVYIIDEVHMLSTGAFNALLKTLEEPRDSLVFILATTEPHKIPATIISRTQRFDFKRIDAHDIVERMKHILDETSIPYEEPALHVIARAAEGGMRDALSMLDQAISFSDGTITMQDVMEVTGSLTYEMMDQFMGACFAGDTTRALQELAEMLASGKEARRLIENLLVYCRDLLMMQKAPQLLSEKSGHLTTAFKELAAATSAEQIFQWIKILTETQTEVRFTNSPTVYLEVATVKLAAPTANPKQASTGTSTSDQALQQLQEQVAQLQQEITRLKQNGGPVSPPATVEKNSSQPKAKNTSQLRIPREQVFQVLREATKSQLVAVKEVWGDLLASLSSYPVQKALMNQVDVVAASKNGLVIAFDHEILCQKALDDPELDLLLSNNLSRLLPNHSAPQAVFVLKEHWFPLRKEFLAELKQTGNSTVTPQQDTDEVGSEETPLPEDAGFAEEEIIPTDDLVVTKAEEMFGSLTTIMED